MTSLPPRDPLAGFFWRPDEEAPDLGVLEIGASTAVAVIEPSEDWLSVHLADELCAIPIRAIREIRSVPRLTEVPRAEAHVLGVTSVRGEIVPVFDPRVRLGLPRPPHDRRARVVIVDAGKGPTGLAVDAVDGVVRLPRSAVEVAPPGLGGDDGPVVGVGRAAGKLLVLLDLAALLEAPA